LFFAFLELKKGTSARIGFILVCKILVSVLRYLTDQVTDFNIVFETKSPLVICRSTFHMGERQLDDIVTVAPTGER
jgi:hypothetical protein